MKRSIPLMMLLALAVLVGACRRDETGAAGSVQTATIERPAPKPGELGTDDVTQTIELADGRSEDEGAGITQPEPEVTVPGSTTSTSTTAATATAPAKPPTPPRKQP